MIWWLRRYMKEIFTIETCNGVDCMKYESHKKTKLNYKWKCFLNFVDIRQESDHKWCSTNIRSIQNFCYIKKPKHVSIWIRSAHSDSQSVDVYNRRKREQKIKFRFDMSIRRLIFDTYFSKQRKRLIGSFLTSTKFWNRLSVHHRRNKYFDDRRRWLWCEVFCEIKRDHYWSCSCCFNIDKKRIMYEMQINTEQLKDIANSFSKEVVTKTLDTSIKKSVVLLERNAIMETPTDTWRLRNSFQSEFRQWYWRLFNPTKYAIYVQEGTKPHNAPFDPIAWRASRKWLSAGAIRRSIKMKWTKANPFMTRAIAQSENWVDQIFQAEIDKLILRFNKT